MTANERLDITNEFETAVLEGGMNINNTHAGTVSVLPITSKNTDKI